MPKNSEALLLHLKSLFLSYWANLSIALFLSLLSQKVLFEGWKPESILFLFLLFLLLSFNKFLRYIAFGISTIISALIPTALLVKTGLISQDFLSILITASEEEFWSYLKTTPLTSIVIALCIWILSYWLIIKSQDNKNRWLSLGTTLILLILLYPFINRNHFIRLYNDWERVGQIRAEAPSWHVTGKLSGKHYQNYVVVLGESLRKDALSLYGNTYKTTPFLDNIPTRSIEGYISAAINTTQAIPKTFSISDIKDRSKTYTKDNIINIAKEAGFETHWITSQRLMKQDDDGATSISLYAEHRVFVPGKDDFNLLPEVEKALHHNTKKKLFVVHLWGSHEDPCNHLEGVGTVFNTGKGKYLDCYLSSVRKTDILLERLIELLKKDGHPYRVLFFPDHAINIVTDGNGYNASRDADFKQSYQIPFVAFDSDTTVSKKEILQQSAYNFVNYFPSWIGVKTNMTPDGFDIFKENTSEPEIVKYANIPAKFSTLENGIDLKDILH